MSKIDQRIETEIVDSLPDINYFSGRVQNRVMIYRIPQEDFEYIPLSWVCLSDMADLVQTSVVALIKAKIDWVWAKDYYRKSKLTMAVAETRYHYDYFAMLLLSILNHFSSSMWHLEEKSTAPLDKYETAYKVYKNWQGRNLKHDSYDILSSLMQNESWKRISDYRHGLVHRGIPVIKGEFRYARRKIWAEADDTPPKPHMMEITLPDGRKSYDTLNMVPDYEMDQLLTWGTDLINTLHDSADHYLRVFDEKVLDMGIWKIKDDKFSWSPL